MGIRENKIKNDYYVYLHKDLNDKIFYVGKGRARRAWHTSGRNKAWHEVAKFGYTVDLHSDGLSEKEAVDIEGRLILSLEGLTNKILHSPVKFNSYAEHFAYDPDAPSGLTRIKGTFCGRGYEKGNLGPCGNKTTRSCGSQVWVLRFKNRTTQVHRIIWQLFNGTIPDGFVIDHIDGNSLNNKISNLRLITQAENSRNVRKRKNNTSGVVGVRLIEAEGESPRWRVDYYDLNGKCNIKHFSILKLGYEEAFILACEYRAKKIEDLNNQGAGYTERHGT